MRKPFEIKFATAVANEVLQIGDVKDYAGVNGDGRDALLSEMIPAVRELHEQWVRLSYLSRTVTAFWDKLDPDNTIFLPFGPVYSIDSIKRVYDDGTESAALAEGTDYYKIGMDFPKVRLYSKWSSSTGKVDTGIKVVYSCGYGSGSGEADMPAPLRTMMLRHIKTDLNSMDDNETYVPVLYQWIKEGLAKYRKEIIWP